MLIRVLQSRKDVKMDKERERGRETAERMHENALGSNFVAGFSVCLLLVGAP